MSRVLSGKVAIITGASQGLGLEIARKYLAAGADLMLCARNAEMLEKVQTELGSVCLDTQKVFIEVADVALENDANRIVSETLNHLGGFHILVNNAGIYGPKGEIEKTNWLEWVRTIEINLLGSVLMTRAVLPHFKQQRYGKIIQLAGGGATAPMPRISAYAASKAAIVRYTETLAEEVRNMGIDVNAIAPGALNTQMLDEILDAGPDVVGKVFYDRSLKQKASGGAGLDMGSELALFLASPASDGISAKLISAVWDKWEDWPKHLEELSSSDAYTLRRIVGKDRGYIWGDR